MRSVTTLKVFIIKYIRTDSFMCSSINLHDILTSKQFVIEFSNDSILMVSLVNTDKYMSSTVESKSAYSISVRGNLSLSMNRTALNKICRTSVHLSGRIRAQKPS